MIGRLKNAMKSLATRLPFLEVPARRSALLRSFFARARLISSARMEDLSTDSLAVRPIRDIPRTVRFQGPFPSEHLLIYLGLTSLPSGLPDVRANILAKDAEGRYILNVPHVAFEHEEAVSQLLQQRFPGVLRWYRHELAAGLDACDWLQVRFQMEGLQGVPSKGLECFCLTLGQESFGGERRWLIDLVGGAPIRIQPGRG